MYYLLVGFRFLKKVKRYFDGSATYYKDVFYRRDDAAGTSDSNHVEVPPHEMNSSFRETISVDYFEEYEAPKEVLSKSENNTSKELDRQKRSVGEIPFLHYGDGFTFNHQAFEDVSTKLLLPHKLSRDH